MFEKLHLKLNVLTWIFSVIHTYLKFSIYMYMYLDFAIFTYGLHLLITPFALRSSVEIIITLSKTFSGFHHVFYSICKKVYCWISMCYYTCMHRILLICLHKEI